MYALIFRFQADDKMATRMIMRRLEKIILLSAQRTRWMTPVAVAGWADISALNRAVQCSKLIDIN